MNNYKGFLEKWIKKGYTFVKFGKDNYDPFEIIMRHDVDFDPKFALKIGEIERDLGIMSTFFFLLSNESYNLLTEDNIAVLKSLKNMGHTISIHFDETIKEPFKSIEERFILEKTIFELIFEDIKIISLHKPNREFIGTSENYLKDIESSYQEKYFSDMEYYADSNNSWRYGSPFDSEKFETGGPFQILTHPVWWTKIDSEKDIKNWLKNRMDLHVSSLLTPKEKK